MRIGIVGSRKRTRHEDYIALMDAFKKIYDSMKIGERIVIVSGGCPTGADSWAEDIAHEYRLDLNVHAADWSNGRGAGLARNTLIAQNSDMLIACWDNVSHGTKDTIDKFKRFHPDGQLVLI